MRNSIPLFLTKSESSIQGLYEDYTPLFLTKSQQAKYLIHIEEF